MRTLQRYAWLLLFALFLGSGPVFCDMVQFVAKGNITSVDSELTHLFSVGDEFVFTVCYDSNTPVSIPTGYPNFGRYYGAVQSAAIRAGDYALTLEDFSNINTISVRNNVNGVADILDLCIARTFYGPAVNSNNLRPCSLSFSLTDSDKDVFDSSLELPDQVPDLSDYEKREFSFMFAEEYNGVVYWGAQSFKGEITELYAVSVPEPGAAMLCVLGLLAAAMFKARKRL